MKKRIVYFVVAVMLLTVVPVSSKALANGKNLYMPENTVQTVELDRRHVRGPERRPTPPPRNDRRPGHRPDSHLRPGHRPPPPPPRHGHRHNNNDAFWWGIIGMVIAGTM